MVTTLTCLIYNLERLHCRTKGVQLWNIKQVTEGNERKWSRKYVASHTYFQITLILKYKINSTKTKKTTVEIKRQVHNKSTDRCTTPRYLWGRRGPQWPPEWAFGTSPALSLSAAHTQCCSGLSTLLKIMATLRFNTLWNELSSLIAT